MGIVKSFKEFIGESIWSDIQDRSSGEVIRDEDKFNPDYIDFGEGTTVYWTVHNFEVDGETRFTIDEIENIDKNGWRLPTTEEVKQLQWKSPYTNFKDNCIDFLVCGPKESRGEYLKLTRDYIGKGSDGSIGKHRNGILENMWTSSVSKWDNKYREAYGFDNTHAFQILLFLPNDRHPVFLVKDKKVNESLWSDIQDRSSGKTIRKEDDVNHFDLNEFYTYIKGQYKTKVEYIDLDSMGDGNGNVLGVDITEDIILFYKPKRGHILLSWSRVKIPMPFFDELVDRFKVENPNAMRRIITEKDGSCTNKTFVDVIDFFLGHKDSLVNESLWSDIQDRSSGETIRKEDERHKILERLLATYIKLFAESCYYHDEYTSGSYPDFRAYIKDFRDNPRIEEVCPDDSYFDDLLNYVNKETWNNQIDDIVMEMTNRLDKGEHLITDDVIEELRKHNVNESIWSDIQDRSSGETVRKEDELTQDDLDAVNDFIFGFATRVVWDGMRDSLTNFLKYIDENPEALDCDIDRVKKYVEDNWHKSICDDVETAIEQEEKEKEHDMNESIWSDIQDRSTGETVRKEDDINLLDIEEFYKYLQAIDGLNVYIDSNHKDFISIDDIIISATKRKSLMLVLSYQTETKKIMTLPYSFSRNYKDIYDKMFETYSLEIPEFTTPEEEDEALNIGFIEIYPKDGGDVTNKFFLDVLNFILVNSGLKGINESLWSDIQDRSTGESVRKEDEIPQELQKPLAVYIDMFASIAFTGEYTVGSYTDFRAFVRDVGNAKRLSGLEYDVNDLLQYVKDHWESLVLPTILDTIDKLNKHINVAVDNIMDNLKDKHMNESLWSDIQDRSAGDTIRKEDEVTYSTLEDEDCTTEMLYNYLIKNYEALGDEQISLNSGKYRGIDWHEVHIPITLDGENIETELDNDDCTKIWSIDFTLNLMKYVEEMNTVEEIDDENINSDTYARAYTGSSPLLCSSVVDFLDEILSLVPDPALRKKPVNESLWSDIQDRSTGDVVRKEDDIELLDMTGLYDYILAHYELTDKNREITYGTHNMSITISSDGDEILLNYGFHEVHLYFDLPKYKLLETELCKQFNVSPVGNDIDHYVVEQGGKYTNQFFIDVLDCIIANRDTILRKKDNVSESLWSDIQDRSTGDVVRKEDEMNTDDFIMLRETAKMFRNVLNRSANEPWAGTCDYFIKFINLRKKEHFWNDTPDETYDKVIKFVKDNWGDCTGIEEFMDKYLSNINECDGVPGGLTPADVGGMGAAYFPGPNGEPGSGDLPSPTGVVYHQVAPYTMFLKGMKKKKKKKKFRIEDEPCAHSENPPIYSHVDDFRDYVDRVYNQIDRKK